MKQLIDEYLKGNFWQVDQNFLKQKIYPIVKNNSIVHDEFFEKKPFTKKREHGRFIGEKINEHDKPFNDDYRFLI
jgi:hypothetical protein